MIYSIKIIGHFIFCNVFLAEKNIAVNSILKYQRLNQQSQAIA